MQMGCKLTGFKSWDSQKKLYSQETKESSKHMGPEQNGRQFAMTYSNAFSWMTEYFDWNFIPEGPIDINSLWPSDTVWQQRSGSTLAQVMADARWHQVIYLN